MNTHDLLANLRRRGVELAAAGDRLRYRPAEALSEADRELLRQHKREILAILAAEQIAPDCRHYAGATPPCPQCGGPTHDAADHLPGIVVLLCDDGERCRWARALTAHEFETFRKTGWPPEQPAQEAS